MRLINKEFMMELVSKLEKIVLRWVKNVPHLPALVQQWLGDNVWWIILIGAIFSGIAFLVSLAGLMTLIALLGAASSTYYVAGNYTSVAVLNGAVGLVFLVINGFLLALAVKPLKEKQKKGWVLLFLTLFVEAVSVIVSAILSFSVLGFIISLLFGAIGLAIGAYFVFEIHGQFSRPPKATIKRA